MRTVAATFLTLLLSTLALQAQPQVAYIIPDIGTPGMNTYVEIVAPTGANGSFGTGGLFVNSGTGESVAVRPANAADSSQVLVGPVIVSWSGRLISTQVFVKPGATVGQTIPLRVTVNGQSTTVNFEIVAPQTLNLTTPGALGSGGAYGTRSKRGAMIVTSANFSAGTWTVSTADPDPSTPGNQGYLPLILISRGSVSLASGARISVDGGSPNAGAGGGGGGGQVCDGNFFNQGGTGGVGGDGFAAGGGGGRNGSGIAHVQQPPGTGTGSSGDALSGVQHGQNSYDCTNPESSGGGSGHPFGTSGQGSCNFATSQGGYGGGGGAGQSQQGGAAGYGQPGGNGGGSSTNGGKAHGNPMAVPVAGGSGGGSANPQIVGGGCGGAGGGGGGALVLYAQTSLDNLGTLTAIGGAGGGSGNLAGGGGSGGYVGIGAKTLGSTAGSLNVSGGAATGGAVGGAGRYRYDGFVSSLPVTVGSAGASSYAGPTIDTLTYSQTATFTLRGAFDLVNVPQIYMYSPAGVWTSLGTPSTIGATWSMPVTVSNGSGYYYFVALQPVPGANPSATYDARPQFVTSQAAANIVQVVLIPKIALDSLAMTFPSSSCGEVTFDTVMVRDTGDAALNVTPSIIGPDAASFSIVSPVGPFTVQPGGSQQVIVRFAPTTPGARTATLRLTNNDPRPGQNPKDVSLTGRRLNLTRSLSAPLDFGDLCVDFVAVRSASLDYGGEIGGSILSITRLGSGVQQFAIVAPATPSPFAAGTGSVPIQVRFRPQSAGAFVDSFRIVTAPCNDSLVLVVRGNGVTVEIDVAPNPLDFGDVRVTTSATLQATVTNTGSGQGSIVSAFITPAGGPFTIPVDPAGRTIAPGATSAIDVTFAPTVTGNATAQLCVVFEGACRDTVCVDLNGRGVTSLLQLSRRSLLLEADSCADVAAAVSDTFLLRNRGEAPVRVNSVVSSSAEMTVVAAPPLPRDLAAGDSILFTVTWTPGTAGTGTITISTEAEDPQQRSMTVDVARRRERVDMELQAGDGSALPPIVDLGHVFFCTTGGTTELLLRNTGTVDLMVNGGFMNGGEFQLTPGPLYTIPAGGEERLTLSLAPTALGEYTDTLILSTTCGREVRAVVHGGRFDLSFTLTPPGGINYGPSNVGLTRTATATLQNTSSTPNNVKVRVERVRIQQGGSAFAVANAPLPKDLAPQEGVTVDVDFTPPSETGFSGVLCFDITSPCDTTLCIPLNGSGIQSNVVVRQRSLNYGTKYLCEDSTLSVSVANTGSAPVELLGLAITGTDAAAFQMVNPVSTPRAIAPGDSVVVQVRFTAADASGDGIRTADLEISTDDAAQPLIRVSLVAERRRQVLATPVTLDFGRVEVGTGSDLTVTLENRTAVPVTLSSLELPAPYSVVGFVPPATLPITIGVGDSVRVVVRYEPTDTTLTTARLAAIQSGPCVDTTWIDVRGQGKQIREGRATIVVPLALTGAPGDRLAIPLILEEGGLLRESEATTMRATLRFDASMLLPVAARGGDEVVARILASSGRIVDRSFDGNDRVVSVEFVNTPLPEVGDTLGLLEVIVALGDARSTPIGLDTVYFTDGPVTVTTRDGLFTVDSICVTGGDRLVRAEGEFGLKRATPNPFTPSTEIFYETVEEGRTSLEIFDLYGRRVASLLDDPHVTPGSGSIVWDATGQPSGLYFAVLTTPTGRSLLRLTFVE